MPLIGTLTSGVSAMRSFTKDLEVIGNNIANVNTVGFKSSRVNFADSFSNTLRNSAPSSGTTTSNSSAVQVGTGVQLSEITTNYNQGTLTSTGVGTDLAISGSGFFMVKNPGSQNLYATRAGNFHFDDQNFLVNDQGYRVQGMVFKDSADLVGKYGDIQRVMNLKVPTSPATIYAPGTGADPDLASITVGTDGMITGTYVGGSTFKMGALSVYDFKDPSALVKEGGNLYTGFGAAGFKNGVTNQVDASSTLANTRANTIGLGKISSGQLEQANVDLTEQFSDMITVQRSFQASSRLISVSDQILEDIVNLKR